MRDAHRQSRTIIIVCYTKLLLQKQQMEGGKVTFQNLTDKHATFQKQICLQLPPKSGHKSTKQI